MEHKKHKKKVVKPKNRFTICCFCLNSSSSEIDLKNHLENNENYDYVVEKLAIKKVPISLFATDEDLEEMQNMNSSISMGDYSYSSKDKKSAMIFSSYYSKIPKNVKNIDNESENKFISANKELAHHKNQENHSIIDVHNSESYKDSCTPVSSIEKDIITAEVYSEPSATRKFLKITPELQETLNKLGSKQRPSGSPGIKKRLVPRANNETTNIISPIMINRRALNKLKQSIPIEAKESEETSQNEFAHEKISKSINSSPNKIEEKKVNDISSESDLTNQRIRNNNINALLTSLTNKAAANQKWKIIIKEHEDDEEGGDDGTTHKSTDSDSEYSTESETVLETE